MPSRLPFVSNFLASLTLLAVASCKHKQLPNQDMIDLLKASAKFDYNHENVFSPEAMVEYCDSVLNNASGPGAARDALLQKANALLQLGEEQKAIDIYKGVLAEISLGDIQRRQAIMKDLAIAWLRLGDRVNCINNHTVGILYLPHRGGRRTSRQDGRGRGHRSVYQNSAG